MNNGSVLAKFDVMVLKPLDLILLAYACRMGFDGSWLDAGLSVVGMFIVGNVGARLHSAQTFDEAFNSSSTIAEAMQPMPQQIDGDDIFQITLASFKIAFVVGILAAIGIRGMHGWIYSVILGALIWRVGGAALLFVFSILLREWNSGQLKSFHLGVLMLWASMAALVFAAAFIVRIT